MKQRYQFLIATTIGIFLLLTLLSFRSRAATIQTLAAPQAGSYRVSQQAEAAQGTGGTIPLFTGNAEGDFSKPELAGIAIKFNDLGRPDVGMPHPAFPADAISGFDMNAFYLAYDIANDLMYVGIDCYRICGDADDDGDPNQTGPILGKPRAQGGLGGVDAPDFGPGESFGLLIDTDNDYSAAAGDFDVVVGVKGDDSLAEIGAYQYIGGIGEQLDDLAWGDKISNTVTLFQPPAAGAPDLEFTIANFSKLPGFPQDKPVTAYQIHIGMGSIVDDGIGEDFAPDQNTAIVITPTPTNTPNPTPTNTPVPPTPTATPLVPTDVPTTGAMLSPAQRRQALTVPQTAYTAPIVETSIGVGIDRPDHLRIPSLQLDTWVAEKGWHLRLNNKGERVAEWEDVEMAAGWHKNSAAPGKNGNVVISGHNNIEGSVFQDLYKVEKGDSIYLWNGTKRYKYIVDAVEIVQQTYASDEQLIENGNYLKQTSDQRLTLISCWPPFSNTHRVFVIAKLDPFAIFTDPLTHMGLHMN